MAHPLRALREAHGLTQRQLSVSSGIPQDVISSLETGRVRNPTWNTVRGLSRALGVEPDAIVGGEPDTASVTRNASTAA